MPRAKKAPSEMKPKDVGTENVAGLAAAETAKPKEQPRKAVAGTTSAAKTEQAAGKPVTSVNPQSSNAGVKSNGKGETDIEAAIRARAYEIWERRGRPEGAGHDDWLQAEREIMAEHGKRTA